MSYTYAQKKRTNAPGSASDSSGNAMDMSVPNSARLAMLESGQISPTAADKGHRVDLPEAMRAKMESSFNMDFSAVKLYESQMAADAGMNAVAQGNEIAFAPGKLNLASESGQALLGHELSHVASQARGEVHGNGFLLDSGLEDRADREGAMAARGESVYGGAVAPLSSASAAPMQGPMQASKKEQRDGGIELIQTGKARPPVDADSDNFILPGIRSAASNMKGYAKNFGSNFVDLFRKNKKAETHKDFMKKSRKDEISARADEEMAKMTDISDAQEDLNFDVMAELKNRIRDKDNEVYD